MSDLGDMMWAEASRDLEAEADERSRQLAVVGTAGLWPFLAAARSAPEFEGRLALADEQISTVAADSGYPVESITGDLRRQYQLLAEARTDPVDHEGHDYDHDDEAEEDDRRNGEDWDRETGYSPFEHWSSRQQAYASLRTALEEGVDPLSWIEDEAEYGTGPEEVGGHQSTGGRADPKA